MAACSSGVSTYKHNEPHLLQLLLLVALRTCDVFRLVCVMLPACVPAGTLQATAAQALASGSNVNVWWQRL